MVRNLFGVDEEATGGPYRPTDPQTSKKAAKGVKIGSYHADIIETLGLIYPQGMTARAVSEHSLATGKKELSPEKANTRLKELRDRGLVDFVRDVTTLQPLEHRTTENNTGRVHALTTRGYNEYVWLAAARGMERYQ